MLKGLSKEKKSKNMNSKMTTSSQLSIAEFKKNKNELSKQLEQEQNHRNGDDTEGYQWGEEGGGEEWKGKHRE